MKKIEAIIRKTKFEDVKDALLEADIEWFSYYDVRGIGKARQGRIYRGVVYDTSTIERILISIVVRDKNTEKTVQAIIKAAQTGYLDLVDVEIFSVDDIVKKIIDGAHAAGVKVIASNHDFFKTPAKADIIYRLRKMQDMNADIPKIAVMPQNKKDVLTLLAATEEMTTNYADRPIITMSMAGTGVISRLCGEVFGSSMTFGAAKKASAPGQMGVNDLNTVLGLLHNAM